jgi:hypothetical protein
VIPGDGDLAAWLAEARGLRAGWRDGAVPMAERRPLLLDAINGLYGKDRGKDRTP